MKYFAVIITYSPKADVTQPLTWSIEYDDEKLALIYYNYRHYNSADGRWIKFGLYFQCMKRKQTTKATSKHFAKSSLTR